MMPRCEGREAAVVVLFLVVSVWTAAGASRADDPAADDLANLPWLDPEEAAALLVELEEAGLVPTDLDLRGLGLEPSGAAEADVRPPTDPAAATMRTDPNWSCRLEARDDGRTRASLDGRCGPLHAGVRASRPPRGLAAALGGCLWAEQATWSMAVGGVGVQHGLGLFCAGPGRARSATIASSLVGGEAGLRHWSSPDGTTGVRGLAAQGGLGPLEAGALVGRLTEGADGSTGARAAWLALRRGSLDVSCAVSPGPGEAGRGVAVRFTGPHLDVQAERADWKPVGGQRAAATAIAVRWRERGLVVEGLAAAAVAPAAPRLGCRPACLIGWDGQGWAVRTQVAAGARVTATLLAAGAADRPARTRALDRDLRHQTEAGVAGRLRGRMAWSLRWRRREDVRWAPDEEAPWLPPQRTRRVITETVVAEAAVDLPADEVVGALRCVERDDGTSDGRRVVATIRWRRLIGRVRWTAGGGWAWGDPVAVTTVSTPALGLAVPRAWSAWDAEVYAGGEASLGPGWVQFAVARRMPAFGPPSGDAGSVAARARAEWEAWLRLAVSW